MRSASGATFQVSSKKPAPDCVGDPVPVEAGQHAQLGRLAGPRRSVVGHRPALRRAAAGADRQLVAGLQRAALEAAERAERIGRAAAEHHRHVDAAGDRDIGARAGLQEIEGEHLARLDAEGRPGLARLAVDLRRQLGAGDGDHRVRA